MILMHPLLYYRVVWILIYKILWCCEGIRVIEQAIILKNVNGRDQREENKYSTVLTKNLVRENMKPKICSFTDRKRDKVDNAQ